MPDQNYLIHVTAGNENWEATVSEMEKLSDLFMSSFSDSKDVVVVTRPGVKVEGIYKIPNH